MGAMDDAERLEPGTVEEWSDWLRVHHDQPQGVWLVSPRRAADRPFSYEESVLEALRYGWVDSTVRPVDEGRSMQWFAPRRAGSMWTRINKGRIARSRRRASWSRRARPRSPSPRRRACGP